MEKEIVKVEKVTAKGKKYLVSVDINSEEYKFTENQIVSNRIIKGALFTLDEWNKIVESSNVSLLFDQMLHFIDYKLRTKKEVIEKLRLKKASESDIKQIIERLENVGYIDDNRYLELYIENAIRELKGPYLIKYTLEQNGIDSYLITKALEKISDDIFLDNAIELAKKYQRTVSNNPKNKQIELIKQKLARNGYYMDVINSSVRSLTFGEDDLEKLKDEYLKIFEKTNDQNKTITSLLGKGYSYSDIKKIKNEIK